MKCKGKYLQVRLISDHVTSMGTGPIVPSGTLGKVLTWRKGSKGREYLVNFEAGPRHPVPLLATQVDIIGRIN